jgi:hypothetical protein
VKTVDWSRWLELGDAEREALRRRYREIIKAESVAAMQSGYAGHEQGNPHNGAEQSMKRRFEKQIGTNCSNAGRPPARFTLRDAAVGACEDYVVRARTTPLAPRLTEAERAAHRTFVVTSLDKPIWSDYLPPAEAENWLDERHAERDQVAADSGETWSAPPCASRGRVGGDMGMISKTLSPMAVEVRGASEIDQHDRRTVDDCADGRGDSPVPTVRVNALKSEGDAAEDGADLNRPPESGPEKNQCERLEGRI